jgi:hypothetical protein
MLPHNWGHRWARATHGLLAFEGGQFLVSVNGVTVSVGYVALGD